MISYIEATYTGQDSSPFNTGQVYCLETRDRWFGGISVRPVHGYEFKPIEDMRCHYANLRDFLVHWKPNKVLDPCWQEKLARTEPHTGQ